MTIQGREELFDEQGNIAVWGHISSSGKPYYTFKITEKDSYIMFPMVNQNPKAPKFILKKTDSSKAPGSNQKE